MAQVQHERDELFVDCWCDERELPGHLRRQRLDARYPSDGIEFRWLGDSDVGSNGCRDKRRDKHWSAIVGAADAEQPANRERAERRLLQARYDA